MVEERLQSHPAMGAYSMVRLVGEMVRAVVDDPYGVRVVGRDAEECVFVTVTVAPGDLGKLIGKSGRTARAMRTVLQAACSKSKLRCQLNLDGHRAEAGGTL